MKVKKKTETIYKKGFFEKLLHYKIPEQYQKGANLLHCNYCGFLYSFMALFCFGIGIAVFAGLCYKICTEGEQIREEYAVLIFFALFGLCFVVLGLLFVFFMKNWSFIFYDGGIWYRSLSGKSHQYSDNEVEGYLICPGSRRGYIMIKLKDSTLLSIGSSSKNYYEAQKLVEQRYTKL